MTTLSWFAGALLVFVILLWSIDFDQFLTVIGQVQLGFIVPMTGLAVMWLIVWSLSLQTVLGVLGTELSIARSVLLYSSVLFASNVTPFGQASGEPIAAALIARVSSTEYEQGLASVVSVDVIHFIPSLTFALFGLAYYMALATVGRYLLLVAFLVVVLSIGLVMVFVLMWRYRYVLEQKLINILTPILLHINHLSTRITTPSPASLEQRIEEFFVALERIATDRSKLLRAIGLSAFGWLIQMLLLWLTFFALGQTISLSVLLFIVPIANIADIVPVPGGLGAIDTMYVVLFVSITPVNATVSTAAVLLFRTIIYGLPTIVGGCSTVFFGTQVFSTGMERY